MQRAKILATLGPASSQESVIRQLIESGMSGVRLNFSHGEAKQHRKNLGLIRQVAADLGVPVAVLQDLQGPKIRVGSLPDGAIDLYAGARVALAFAPSSDDPTVIPHSYRPLSAEVAPGDKVLLDDGRLVLRVVKREGERTICTVEVGGPLSNHKGVNLPNVPLSTPALTQKDRDDLTLGQQLGVDFVALSFVRSVEDVVEAKKLVGEVPLIAKIEKPEALECIEGIIDECDGIMVARGDLGVEMGPERVPMLQKELIEKANATGKLVITATEMLDSMRQNSRPTRAEVSDVANAVLDGTDAVMLSGETAIGAYPVEAVRTMARIICETESSVHYGRRVAAPPTTLRYREATSAIARASVAAAAEIDARAIICFTESGSLPTLISDYRPPAQIIAATETQTVYDKLALHWGVIPLLLHDVPPQAEQTIQRMSAAVLSAGLVAVGSPGTELEFAL